MRGGYEPLLGAHRQDGRAVMFIHPAPGAAGVRKAPRNPMLIAKHADAGGKSRLNPAYPQRHPPICIHGGQHLEERTRTERRVKLPDCLGNFGGRGWNRTIDPPRVKRMLYR